MVKSQNNDFRQEKKKTRSTIEVHTTFCFLTLPLNSRAQDLCQKLILEKAKKDC